MLDLGMTANAAAAHENDSSSPLSSGRSTPKPTTIFGFPLRFMSVSKRENVPPSSPDNEASIVASPSEATSPIYSPRGSIDAETGHGTATNDGTRHHKQVPRPKTSFRFAHPPPGTRPKRLRIRPRLLLQLHKVSQTTRPVPTFDVVPSSLFEHLPVTRRFTNATTKERTGGNDLIVVPSESYDSSGGDDKSISSDDGHDDQRKPVARLCKARKDDRETKGIVEVCHGKGARWEVTPLQQGGYEFVTTDEHGVQQCVRWVLRTKMGRQNSNFASGAGDDGKRFTFSIIDPRTRRHPIIAWMSRTGIDILDQYALSVSNRVASSAASTVTTQVEPSADDKSLVDTDDSLRTLITVTGLWIAFREGWSENPCSSEAPNTLTLNSPIPPSPGPSNTPRISNENRRADKRGHRNSIRIITNSNTLHPTTSNTAESWRSARSPSRRDRSTDSAAHNRHEQSAKQPSKRISFVERVSCMGGDFSSDDEFDDTKFRSLQAPVSGTDGPGSDPRPQDHGSGAGNTHGSAPTDGHGVGMSRNGNGTAYAIGNPDPGKPKKKAWRRISGWFGGKTKEEKEKEKRKPKSR